MDDANAPVCGFDFHGRWQLAKGREVFHAGLAIQCHPPFATVEQHPAIQGAVVMPGLQRHVLVVADTGMKPGPGQPLQRFGGFRAAINEIAHGKQAVGFRVEIHIVQGLAQGTETPMNIAHDEITATLRQWERDYPDLARLQSLGRTDEGRELWLLTVGVRASPPQNVPTA